MDPNATLAEIRELIETENTLKDGQYTDDIIERFEALDEWLSKGGFLPADWDNNANR